MTGDLFIISAPSGAGKTSLIREMRERRLVGHRGLVHSVSHTTRQPRRSEVDGRDYHFVDDATFQEMVDAGRFLEWATVFGKCYGTSAAEVMAQLELGNDVILDIDVQGALQVMESHLEAHSIFILPPSYEELAHRLRERGLDEAEEINRRLAVSHSEIELYEQYDYAIINDDLRRASDVLAAIILEKRHLRKRMREGVEEVLQSFQRKLSPQ